MPIDLDPFDLWGGDRPAGTPAQDVKLSEIAAYGFAEKDIPTAVPIAIAESGGRADAVGTNTNGTKDIGLWQINTVHLKDGGLLEDFDTEQLKNPYVNARAAAIIRKAQGWNAWTVYKSGAWKQHRGKDPVIHVGANQTPGKSGIEDALSDAADAVASPVEAVGDFLGLLGQSSTWFRIGKVVAGGVLMAAGAIALISAGGKTVARVTPAGRLAKAVTK